MSPGLPDFNGGIRLISYIDIYVNAHLDPNTGLLTWTFTTINPNNSLPPEPSYGFLPPGAQGSVFFTVMPKKGVSTGTVTQAQATLVFGTDPPVNTAQWFNTLE